MNRNSQHRVMLGTHCPDCGTHISSAKKADYDIRDHSVRYLWLCDECDAEFETLEEFAAAA